MPRPKSAALLLLTAFAAASPAADPPAQPDVLTLAEAASLLRVPPQTVVKLARAGSVPARQVGKEWRFNRLVLMQWLQGERYAYPGVPMGAGRAAAANPAPTAGDAAPPLDATPLPGGELASLTGRGAGALGPRPLAQAPAPAGPEPVALPPTAAPAEPPKPIGESPTGLTAEEVALRDQGVLLKRGATTLELGLSYARQTRESFPALRVEQNTTTASLAARHGLRDDLQVSARLPGIYRRTATFADETVLGSGLTGKDSDSYAGDLAFSLQGVALRERSTNPNLTWSIDAVVPTGPGDTGLGAGLVLSRTYDPVVIYGGLNYLYGSDIDRSDPRRVLARNNWSLSLGYAYAINDSLALTGAFAGFYRTPSDGGSSLPPERESYLLQFGMTWQLAPGLFVEPAVAVGVGGTASDMAFSINLPYTF